MPHDARVTYFFPGVVLTLAILHAGGATSLVAQSARTAEDSVVTVVPGPEYKARGIKRFFFGTDYRGLWLDSVPAPVIDLGSYSGGLRAICSPASLLTRDLTLRDSAGVEYRFRSSTLR